MNKFKRKKLIEKFYEKVMDLTVYLDAPLIVHLGLEVMEQSNVFV